MKSCIYEGEYDGIAYYNGFQVGCHTEGENNWIVDYVE